MYRNNVSTPARSLRALSLASALGIAACLGQSGCSDSSEPPPQPIVTPVDRATAATITARVTYGGTIPEPIEINMKAAGACAELHAEPVYEQPVQVADGKLANVLVYIKGGLENRAFRYPEAAVVIDQRGCLYHPRVTALMVGQPLKFLNSDPEAHNVRGRPDEVEDWNFMMSRKGAERTLHFDKPEIGIRVGCDVHPWMSAWVSVLPHPYFGITGPDGQVVIGEVPPGEYVVSTWHETLGTREQAVTLPASGAVTIEIAY